MENFVVKTYDRGGKTHEYLFYFVRSALQCFDNALRMGGYARVELTSRRLDV